MLYRAENSFFWNGEERVSQSATWPLHIYLLPSSTTKKKKRLSTAGWLTMTPKLRLSEQARKALLSWMRKWPWPGIKRTNMSTQMTHAPKTQAVK